ncbi:hypothetical protein KHS38_15990 [Mucilaginibacter sp. Bleaf8]|uniref:hypothetical protein n=1 Tax=Mucilaginibacter sp. Bleaf8 TaxID=2834430 RepID=UPI001BCF68C7|nr:hypothetical protein [Mucilaginibacter sp. Bleaf8]MBS7565909.1 hypothetical protein [Mucilaginibacter sp. Bleaf8]
MYNKPGILWAVIIRCSIIVLLLGCFYSASAQKADSAFYKRGSIYYMAGGNLGLGSLTFYASGYITLAKNGYEISAKVSYNDNLSLLFNEKSNKVSELKAYDLLVGKKLTHHPYSNITVSTGLSYVRITRPERITYPLTGYYGPDVDRQSYTAGLPIEAKFVNTGLSRFVGLTITAGANLNLKNSFCYGALGLQLGKMRERKRR